MRALTGSDPLTIFTIGHSTRELAAFTKLLLAHGVKQLVDVRTIPRSLRNPQYNADTLPRALKAAGIRYVHLAALGGLRHARRDSINKGWRNASFRGFADYMQQPGFQKGVDQLVKLGRARPTAIMCAEAVPWRCHRFLISDALVTRGAHVEHIMSESKAQPHSLIPFARIDKGQITYPAVENEPAQRLLPGMTGETAPSAGKTKPTSAKRRHD